MRRLIALAASVTFLAACQPMPATDAGGGATDGTVRTDADCARQGGTMQRVGRAQTLQCVIAYADAGKPCTDSDQCQGQCRGDSTPYPAAGQPAQGRCQANNQPFGCFYTVENGHAEHALCVD